MSGPDFEIAPDIPSPVPEERSVPVGKLSRRLRAATCAAVLGFVGTATFAWYPAQGGDVVPTASLPDRQPPTTPTTETPRTTTSSTRPTTTTRAPVTRTCMESSESPDAANGSVPEGFPWITFHVSPRVAGTALARMAKEASEAREAFGDAGALGLRVYCDIEELATASNTPVEETRESVTAGRVAYMYRGDIWLFGPSVENRTSLSARRTVYHEYFHALQRSLSRTRSTRSDTAPPLWLIEGTARYFENAVSRQELDAFRRGQIRRWEALPALETLERSGGAKSTGGTGDAYTVGAVATDYLVTKYGRERIATDYWVALADADWRSAFRHVFGVSVDAFYSEFETYRQTLRP